MKSKVSYFLMKQKTRIISKLLQEFIEQKNQNYYLRFL